MIKGKLYTYCRNTYPKGRALMKMYRVVPQTKRTDCHLWLLTNRRGTINTPRYN